MVNMISREYPFSNEPVQRYLPGSQERLELESELAAMQSGQVDIPAVIGRLEVRTGTTEECRVPHNHRQVLGKYHVAGRAEARMAVETALGAKRAWESLPWETRAAVFLRAAELAAGPWRAKLNAATMLAQSKTAYQAEIDAACELIDFLRYNVACLREIYAEQPISAASAWNRVDYRPLEGFVLAVSPFNFTSIGGNLCIAPALCGNTVIWKPASTAVYSSYVVFELFRAAGLPEGVITFLPAAPDVVMAEIVRHPSLSGIHFTGSTGTFQTLWRAVGEGIDTYRTFPRLVGETGGKNFVIMHPSANAELVVKGIVEGAFEYQGQKCSAVSRAYIPQSCWPHVRDLLLERVAGLKMGDVSEADTFMGAIIDRKAFRRVQEYIEGAAATEGNEIIAGGRCDDSQGYFVEPTVIVAKDPLSRTMVEEIFGPVLTVYVYGDGQYDEALRLCDSSTPYALTGSVYACDPYAVSQADEILRHAAGNLYINTKPTGAVVGQQPFGGARQSGTNDKAGSKLNIMRWMSPRTIKESMI